MIVSNEPGYYRKNRFGIRSIENLLAVAPVGNPLRQNGKMLEFRTLTLAPLEHRLIDSSLLYRDEIEWLDSYHETIFETLSPHCTPRTAALARPRGAAGSPGLNRVPYESKVVAGAGGGNVAGTCVTSTGMRNQAAKAEESRSASPNLKRDSQEHRELSIDYAIRASFPKPLGEQVSTSMAITHGTRGKTSRTSGVTPPDAVVRPKSTEDVARVVADLRR